MRGFVAGLTAGAAIGLLTAPDRGSKTRQRLRRQGNEIAKFVREQSNEFKRILRNPEAALESVREKLGPRVGQAVETTIGAVASRLGIGPVAILNTVERERLMEVDGIGPVLADRIIEGRPYSSPQELVERGILPDSTFRNLERELLKSR